MRAQWLILVATSACGTVLGLDDLIYDVGPGGSAGGAGGAAGEPSAGGQGGMEQGGGGVGGGPAPVLILGPHTKGPAHDAFAASPSTSAVLLRFQLSADEPVTVDSLSVAVASATTGVTTSDVEDLELWLDEGAVKGAIDGGDAVAATAAASGLTFQTEIAVVGAHDYLLSATVNNLEEGDTLALELVASDIVVLEGPAGGPTQSSTHTRDPNDLASNDARLFYRDDGAAPALQTRTWRNDSWTSAVGTTTVSGPIAWVATPELRRTDVSLVGVLTDTGAGADLTMVRGEGSTWASDWTEASAGSLDPVKRCFDIAYEHASRNALVVYSLGTNDPQFRVRDAESWTAPLPVFTAPPSAAAVEWILLVSQPDTNEITMLFSNADEELYGAVWDGAAWGMAQLLEADLNRIDFQNFAGAYERSSLDLLVAWAHPVNAFDGFFVSTRPLGVANFTSASYVSALTKPGVVVLAPERGTNRIAIIHAEHSCDGAGCDNVEGAVWNGSAVVGQGIIDGDIAEPYGLRPGTTPVAGAWVGTSGTAIGVFVDLGADLDWASTTGGLWTDHGNAATSPTIGEIVNAQALDLDTHALVILSDTTGALWAKLSDGAGFTNTEGGAALGDVGINTSRPFAAARQE